MLTLKALFKSYGKRLDTMFQRQKRVFVNFLNTRIGQFGRKVDKIEDLFTGIDFVYLLKTLVPEGTDLSALDRMNKRSKNQIIAMNNCQMLLQFLGQEGMQLHGVTAMSLSKGDDKILLGLLWSIITHYHLHANSGKPIDRNYIKVMRWVNGKLPAEHQVDDVTSWGSGMSLYHLIKVMVRKEDPDADEYMIKDIENKSAVEILQECFEYGDKKFGVPQIITPDDLITDPDELTILTYISFYKNMYRTKLRKKKREKSRKRKSKKKEVDRKKKTFFKSFKPSDAEEAKKKFKKEAEAEAKKAPVADDDDEEEEQLFNLSITPENAPKREKIKKEDIPKIQMPEPEVVIVQEPPTPQGQPKVSAEAKGKGYSGAKTTEDLPSAKALKLPGRHKQKMLFTLGRGEFASHKKDLAKARKKAKKREEKRRKKAEKKKKKKESKKKKTKEKKEKKPEEEVPPPKKEDVFFGIYQGEETNIHVKEDKIVIGLEEEDPEATIPFGDISMVTQDARVGEKNKPIVFKIQAAFEAWHYITFFDKVGEEFEICLMKKLSLSSLEDFEVGEFAGWYQGKEITFFLKKTGFEGGTLFEIHYKDITLFESYEYREKKVYNVETDWGKGKYELTFYERTKEFEAMLLKFIHQFQES